MVGHAKQSYGLLRKGMVTITAAAALYMPANAQNKYESNCPVGQTPGGSIGLFYRKGETQFVNDLCLRVASREVQAGRKFDDAKLDKCRKFTWEPLPTGLNKFSGRKCFASGEVDAAQKLGWDHAKLIKETEEEASTKSTPPPVPYKPTINNNDSQINANRGDKPSPYIPATNATIPMTNTAGTSTQNTKTNDSVVTTTKPEANTPIKATIEIKTQTSIPKPETNTQAVQKPEQQIQKSPKHIPRPPKTDQQNAQKPPHYVPKPPWASKEHN